MNDLEIFAAAMEIDSAEERSRFLERACEGDPALRRRVEELLRSAETADDFLETPPSWLCAAPAEPVLDEGPGTRIGPYTLLEVLGEGGMGIVYEAEQTEPVQRRVALKIIKPGMDSHQVIARFESERQALALMDHPNIARVLDAGTTPSGRPYFVMERVPGIRITAYCAAHHLSLKERLELFIQVCQAVQHAHQKGVIHRDLKPGNVLVALVDGRHVPKVIDFGVAKATCQTLGERTQFTQLGQVVGTPEYMSPEQAGLEAVDVDTRSDVYSLGVLLYEMLTGETPLDRKRLHSAAFDEMLRIIREEEPPRPSTRVTTSRALAATLAELGTETSRWSRSVRGDLDWIVMRALEKDRSRRYDTARGFANDVGRYLRHEPISARPPSTAYRFRKFARRHGRLLTAGALIAVTLIAGTVMSTWQAVRADRLAEERRARLIRTYVDTGIHHLKDGELTLSLPWLVEALALEDGDPAREETHRLRIGSVLGQCATPVHVWFHDGPVSAADMSSDGKRVVAAVDESSQFPIWNAATGELEAVLEHPTAEEVRRTVARFSPDGERVATAAGSTVWVWDPVTAQGTGPLEHPARVTNFTFDNEGGRLLTWSENEGIASVWDCRTGELLFPPIDPGEYQGLNRIIGASFTPDGQYLVLSGEVGVHLFDATTGEWLTEPDEQHDFPETHAVSPDGRRIAVCTQRYYVRLHRFDRSVGELIGMLRHQAIPHLVMFSPTGQWVATGSEDCTARVWDGATALPVTPPLRHGGEVFGLAFDSSGRYLATASEDHTARVWEVRTGRLVSMARHGASVNSVELGPDGRRIVTASSDGTVRLWDIGSRFPAATLEHEGLIVRARFSEDGSLVLTGAAIAEPGPGIPMQEREWDTGEFRGEVRVWDAETGFPLGPPLAHETEILDLRASPDGERIATLDRRHARVWSTRGGAPLSPWIRYHDMRVRPHGWTPGLVRFGVDAETIVTCSAFGSYTAVGEVRNWLRVWDATTGEPRGPPFPIDAYASWFVHDSVSGDVYMSTRDPEADRNELLIWNESSSETRWLPLETTAGIQNIVLGPGRRRMFVEARTQTRGVTSGQIFDLESGAPLTERMEYLGNITKVVFSRDGRLLATTCFDQTTARVWDATTGRPWTPVLHHTANVYDVSFSPDHRLLATATSADFNLLTSGSNSADPGSAQVLDIDTAQPITQPLDHGGDGGPHVAQFHPTRRVLLTAGGQKCAYLWHLEPETAPVDALRDLAMLLSSRHLDEQGRLVPLERVEPDLWERVRSVLRDRFPPSGISPDEEVRALEREANAGATPVGPGR